MSEVVAIDDCCTLLLTPGRLYHTATLLLTKLLVSWVLVALGLCTLNAHLCVPQCHHRQVALNPCLASCSMPADLDRPEFSQHQTCTVADCSAALLQACDIASCKVWGLCCYISSSGIHVCSAVTCASKLGRLISYNWLHISDYKVAKARGRWRTTSSTE